MAPASGMTSSGQPSRPYSSPEQVPAGPAPRSAEFDRAGRRPGQPAKLSSLIKDADKFSTRCPSVRARVLQTAMPSANGMAAADYQRVLPGLSRPLPSPNGSSADSYQKSLIMRLSGLDAE
jgi:hypothetical protein